MFFVQNIHFATRLSTPWTLEFVMAAPLPHSPPAAPLALGVLAGLIWFKQKVCGRCIGPYRELIIF